MNRLIIIGASGHGKVVADIAALNGYTDIVFLDDNETIKECAGCPIVGKTDVIPMGDLFIAIGNCEVRYQLMNRYADRFFPTLIHPNAVVAKSVTIGRGTVVMAGAVVNPFASIGEGCIINTCSSVDHDCIIGDCVHVAVGAHVCGTVSIGEKTWVGTGATISNNISICSDCIIGAGAVVLDNIITTGTYVGVPVRILDGGKKK